MEALGNKDFARGFSVVDGDDLLDFSLDVEADEGNKKYINYLKGPASVSSSVASGGLSSLPADEEEELEWLSNKDAFPAVEFDILDDKPETGLLEQHSPVSVLESVIINGKGYERSGIEKRTNCGILQVPSGFPNFARKKRIGRKRRIGFSQNKHLLLVGHEISVVNVRNYRQGPPIPPAKVVRNGVSTVKRSCLHCGSDKTPQWRAGPMGPKTLCNACGVRYKSGRLVPEYRPASSPTFSSGLHSNSHRKIVEMRRLKQVVKTDHGEGDILM